MLDVGRDIVMKLASMMRTAGASRDEVIEAVAYFENVLIPSRRAYGPLHPYTLGILAELDRARMILEDHRSQP